MTDALKRYLESKGISIDEAKLATKTDLETKLRSTLDVLLAEIGASDAVNSTTCNGITNTTNATINGSPATYIKSLARMMKTNHRADIRDIKLILRELSVHDDLG